MLFGSWRPISQVWLWSFWTVATEKVLISLNMTSVSHFTCLDFFFPFRLIDGKQLVCIGFQQSTIICVSKSFSCWFPHHWTWTVMVNDNMSIRIYQHFLTPWFIFLFAVFHWAKFGSYYTFLGTASVGILNKVILKRWQKELRTIDCCGTFFCDWWQHQKHNTEDAIKDNLLPWLCHHIPRIKKIVSPMFSINFPQSRP